MRRLIRGVRVLLPSAWAIAVYWMLTLGLLVLVTMGLEPNATDAPCTLWGLPLRHFGRSTNEVLANAYIEMMRHVWTLFALPFVSLIGNKPLRYSFHNNFLLFLHYSRSSRLFIEATRLLALVSLLVIASVPFAAGSLWGIRWPGLSGEEAMLAFTSCLACLALAAAITYLLSSCGSPAEVAGGIGIAVPFLLEGLNLLSEKGGWELAANWLPAGLPYAIETYNDESVLAAAVVVGSVVMLRLVAMCHTRWLCPSGKPSTFFER